MNTYVYLIRTHFSSLQDGTKQKRERKKTVSFSSMPTEKKISSASDCINSMVEGSELKKVRSNSRIYHRYFLLDADMQSLRWEPEIEPLSFASVVPSVVDCSSSLVKHC